MLGRFMVNGSWWVVPSYVDLSSVFYNCSTSLILTICVSTFYDFAIFTVLFYIYLDCDHIFRVQDGTLSYA